MMRGVLLCWMAWMWLTPAHAHKASDAYATLRIAQGQGTALVSLAIKDLDAAIVTMDADNNRELTWAELEEAMPRVVQRLGDDLSWQCGQEALRPAWRFESLEQRSDGAYVRLGAPMACADSASLQLDYRFLQGIDPTHRLIIAGQIDGQALASVVSDQQRRLSFDQRFSAASGQTSTSRWSTLRQFFSEGVHHIVTGYDHLAFLLALLLPIRLRRTVVVREDRSANAHHGFWMLLSTVTAFTVGHSITLILASLEVIASPSWVEPAIVITIAVSALLNLWPVKWLRPDALALGFGLIHGLGFSSIMREAGVDSSMLPWALGGFNLGVEAGQLVGVVLWCGLNLLLGSWRHYERVLVQGGSVALVLVSMYWLWPWLTLQF